MPVKIQRSLNWKGFIIQEVDGDFLARTIVRITYIGANPDEFVLANSVELAKHMINSGEVYNRFDQMHGDGAEFGHVGIKCSGS